MNAAQNEIRERYLRLLDERWDRGGVENGERSWSAPIGRLLDELEQEAADLAGWGLFVFAALDRLRRRASMLENAEGLVGGLDAALRELDAGPRNTVRLIDFAARVERLARGGSDGRA